MKDGDLSGMSKPLCRATGTQSPDIRLPPAPVVGCVGVPGVFGPPRQCRRPVPRRNKYRCGPCDREIVHRQQAITASLYPRRAVAR
jgi:hypothetical protein